MAKKFEPENVLQACLRRGMCRVGVRGLKMKHLPTDREFVNYGLSWCWRSITDEPLVVHTAKEVIRPPAGAKQEDIDRFESGEMLFVTLDWFVDNGLGLDPEVNPEQVYARDCVLLERWPTYCCRPGRKVEPMPVGRERYTG